MYVVRHHHKYGYDRVVVDSVNFFHALSRKFTDWGQMWNPVFDFPKIMDTVFGADGDKIRCAVVIVPIRTRRFPMGLWFHFICVFSKNAGQWILLSVAGFFVVWRLFDCCVLI